MTRRPLRRAEPARSASLRPLLALLLAWLPLLLGACTSVEDDRIRQLLHERGFGTRADGNARAENFVAGGDEIQFLIDPNIYRLPGHEQLYLLTQTQPVAIDGTIYVPYVGPVYVLGRKETDLSAQITELLGAVFTTPIEVEARIFSTGKGFYLFGEVEGGARWVPMVHGDLTLLEVIARSRITLLANLGRVRLIKPDAQDPLVVYVNLREIIDTGNTTYNLPIDHNDIVYIPPTFLGHIARFMEKLVQPIGAVTRAAFGVAGFRATYDYLVYDEQNQLLFSGGGGGGYRGF